MVSKRTVKQLKKLHREETKGLDLSTKVIEDKRTKRNRTRSSKKRSAIKEGLDQCPEK